MEDERSTERYAADWEVYLGSFTPYVHFHVHTSHAVHTIGGAHLYRCF
jgi:hypothetical protein